MFINKAHEPHMVFFVDDSQEAQLGTGARSLLQANTEDGSNLYMVNNKN
jgi:diaminopimelate epimerase